VRLGLYRRIAALADGRDQRLCRRADRRRDFAAPPDQKMVYLRNWEDEKTRLARVARLLRALVKIARSKEPDADVVAPPHTSSLVKPPVARRA
jgi:hypothetical protein